jgi:hypothetical protein
VLRPAQGTRSGTDVGPLYPGNQRLGQRGTNVQGLGRGCPETPARPRTPGLCALAPRAPPGSGVQTLPGHAAFASAPAGHTCGARAPAARSWQPDHRAGTTLRRVWSGGPGGRTGAPWPARALAPHRPSVGATAPSAAPGPPSPGPLAESTPPAWLAAALRDQPDHPLLAGGSAPAAAVPDRGPLCGTAPVGRAAAGAPAKNGRRISA